MNENSMIIGIDFDGTIVDHMYPSIGIPVPGALETMRELEEAGHRLILWTMRSGETLADAVKYIQDNGIKLWGINANPDQIKSQWSTSPKAYCQIYIDDAAMGCPLNFISLTREQKINPSTKVSTRPSVDWGKVREILGLEPLEKEPPINNETTAN